MKHIDSIGVRITVAVVIGFLFAGVGTDLTYSCEPLVDDPHSGCVSFEKALMHPGDLIANKDDGLVRFSEVFAVTSIASFAGLSAIALIQKKQV